MLRLDSYPGENKNCQPPMTKHGFDTTAEGGINRLIDCSPNDLIFKEALKSAFAAKPQERQINSD